MTHGPPRGILDQTYSKERAGCPDLFAKIAQARPLIHCFGHIHEGWGARYVQWKGSGTDTAPTHFTAIDNERSRTVLRLADLREGRVDDAARVAEKQALRERLGVEMCERTWHCEGDQMPLEMGEQTLFVNASIETVEEERQWPWCVDVELPLAGM